MVGGNENGIIFYLLTTKYFDAVVPSQILQCSQGIEFNNAEHMSKQHLHDEFS